jgi:anti-sigma factor RsiW
MKDWDDRALAHVSEASLIKAVDDELSSEETREIEAHLSVCEDCGRRYHALRRVSETVESALAAIHVDVLHEQRARLASDLETREAVRPAVHSSRPLRRLSWAMAAAAALALGLLITRQWKHAVKTAGPPSTAEVAVLEVDGERFVALPYSNPDLPLNDSHIVQMQVPVSSLADAGIVFEPISNEMSAPDRSVLADVLLGIDGRPLGIHVVSAE